MAVCQHCGDPRAEVIDRDSMSFDELDAPAARVVTSLSEAADFPPRSVRVQLVACPACGRTYRQLVLAVAVEERYAKRYIRAGA